MRQRIIRWIVAIAALWLLFLGLPWFGNFYTDWLWFKEVGYLSIFWKTYWAQILVGSVAGAAFFAIVYSNVLIARRLATRSPWYEYESQIRQQVAYQLEHFLGRWLGWVAFLICLVIAYIVGSQMANNWLPVLLALNPTSFGQADPLFGKDLGFYVFQLPLLDMIQALLSGALIVAFIFAATTHYLDKAIRTVRGIPSFAPHVKVHLSILLGLWLLVKAWGYWLGRYDLLYSERGVVFGATYADVHARLFMIYVLFAIAVLGALLVLLSARSRGFVIPIGVLVLLIVVSLVGALYPAAIQQYVVNPSELTREATYIERNIKATRFGFNIDKVTDAVYPGPGESLQPFTQATLDNDDVTVENVRLWDHRPLLDAYTQKQRLQPYYAFHDVDIDRYTLNNQYRQVMLSAREIDLDTLPGAGWQNEHLVYTHGYGAVLSPVKEATGDGDPLLLVRDVPPVSSAGLPAITRPGIYYGEIAKQDQYSLVRTNMPENDYPLSSNESATTTYTGKGGAPIGSALQKLAFSLRFSDYNLLFSANIKPDSRIIFNRSLYDRLNTIAPFLIYDADPYLVMSDSGKLYWMRDAYTMSGRLPYSQPQNVFPQQFLGRINYIRNSVKVVVDAYDGTVQFFTADTKDPILQSLAKVFPGTFKPLNTMPENLTQHIRYPEQLFNLQAQVLATYHMTQSRQFYSKTDRWRVAREKAGKQTTLQAEANDNQDNAAGEPMQAYYALMRLPGSTDPEFILMIPFTPMSTNNMVAWMAARCDPENYGEIVTYEFPRSQQAFGPIQFEASIDQQGEISKLFSWWGQRGSQVVRGNLLIIPLGKSILYVEPVFLRAEEAAIPQLKLVVVGRQEGESLRVSFGPTLERALASAVGSAPPLTAESLLTSTAGPTPSAPPTPTPAPRAAPAPAAPVAPPTAAPAPAPTGQATSALALDHYRRAQERLRAGDLAGYQKEIDQVRVILEQMQKEGK